MYFDYLAYILLEFDRSSVGNMFPVHTWDLDYRTGSQRSEFCPEMKECSKNWVLHKTR